LQWWWQQEVAMVVANNLQESQNKNRKQSTMMEATKAFHWVVVPAFSTTCSLLLLCLQQFDVFAFFLLVDCFCYFNSCCLLLLCWVVVANFATVS